MLSVMEQLPLHIESEDGFVYVIDAWRPSSADLAATWQKYDKYRILFSDYVLHDFLAFTNMVMARETLVFTVQQIDLDGESREVGLFYGTQIRPSTTALAHYVFWDHRSSGRHRLILAFLRYIMDELQLHRVDIAVPIFAFSALHRLHQMGIRIEGRKREAVLFQGRWSDILEFGICRSELTDEVIERGAIVAKTDDEYSGYRWYGLLKNHELLARKILRNHGSIDSTGRPDSRSNGVKSEAVAGAVGERNDELHVHTSTRATGYTAGDAEHLGSAVPR